MIQLHKAAKNVVEVWKLYGTRESLRGWMQILEAALAEPVQEPTLVAWMVYTEGGTSAYVTDNPNDLVGAYRALPLYTAPPQRKPLTEEEIDKLEWAPSYENPMTLREGLQLFTRAIERAHGIWSEA